MDEQDQKNVAGRVASLPLVSSAYDMVSAAYASTKESHPYVKSVCDAAEKGVKTIASAAASGAQPILSKLEPQISTANEYACKGLDKLEEKLPILQQPTDKEVVSGSVEMTRSAVSGGMEMTKSAVSGGMEMTKSAVSGGMEMTKSAVSSSVNTVMSSSVGQMVSSGVDAVLGKSEELVDRYLPITDEELGEWIAFSPLEEGKIDQVKQGVDEKLQSGQEKLHQMWLEWKQKHSPETTLKDIPDPKQLQSTTMALVSNLQGLPAGLQEKVSLVRQNVEDLRTSFLSAKSFQDLSSSVLAQSREKVAKARELTEELMDQVVHNAPLSWLVGPFTPSGKPEVEEIEME
ncbi:hypothetical protein JD844_034197 [Phrynosoma platyrhinos]|uniref:Perilipin n=1 Tax=Phrynosoma platyrhinos TaxID=52577 RepID=A0ABQ7T851_PHRPL|nr:hypothetical protein JD844_034197 [Phrynosoma platyrhinos]